MRRWAIMLGWLVGCGATDPLYVPAGPWPGVSTGDTDVPAPTFEPLPISTGTGGAIGTISARFTDPSGRRGRYVMDVPDDIGPDRPRGLLLWFHADGADGDYEAELDLVREAAVDHALIPVSLQEPDRFYWWAPLAEDNTAYVSAFVDHLLTRYPIDPNRIYVGGWSGGTSFASGWHLLDGYRFRGGLVGLCGADIPRLNVPDPDSFDYDLGNPPAAPVPEPIPDAAKAHVAYYMAIGRRDFLRELSEATATFYGDLGFRVRHDLLDGRGHCTFDLAAQVEVAMDWLDPQL